MSIQLNDQMPRDGLRRRGTYEDMKDDEQTSFMRIVASAHGAELLAAAATRLRAGRANAKKVLIGEKQYNHKRLFRTRGIKAESNSSAP